MLSPARPLGVGHWGRGHRGAVSAACSHPSRNHQTKGTSVKQHFIAVEIDAEGSLRRVSHRGLATSNQTDQGHPAARRPTGISARDAGGYVRYQQSGLAAAAFQAVPLDRTTREPRRVPGAVPGRSVEPQAELGRRVCGELVAKPTVPVHTPSTPKEQTNQ